MGAERSSEIMTLQQVAEYLQVPVTTVYDWRTRGIGPKGSRVGRYVRYRKSVVDAWLDRQAERNGAGAA